MLEGLLAALAMFFAPAPQPEPEPMPVASLDGLGCSLPNPDYKPPPPVFVVIDADGRLAIRRSWAAPDRAIDLKRLGAELQASAVREEHGYQRIFLVPDGDPPYASVLSVISALKHNGFYRIGLVQEDIE